MPKLDVLVYHELDDTVNNRILAVGEPGSLLGERFADYTVVAVIDPLHEGKDATVVLADDPTAAPEL